MKLDILLTLLLRSKVKKCAQLTLIYLFYQNRQVIAACKNEHLPFWNEDTCLCCALYSSLRHITCLHFCIVL